jgi:lactoylglutathione lyase
MTVTDDAPLRSHAPRLLHAMLPVRDLDVMLGFYCGLLGMQELRRIEFQSERYTLVFIGYETAPLAPQLEFRWQWDAARQPAATPVAAVPGAAGHIGIGVERIEAACATLAARGVPIRRAPAAMRPGGRVIALIEDPEGNEVELLAL